MCSLLGAFERERERVGWLFWALRPFETVFQSISVSQREVNEK